MRRWTASCAAVGLLACAALPAAAQDDAVMKFFPCTGIADPGARLACYDRAAATAKPSGSFVQAPAAAVPAPSSRADASAAASPEQRAATLKTLRNSGVITKIEDDRQYHVLVVWVGPPFVAATREQKQGFIAAVLDSYRDTDPRYNLAVVKERKSGRELGKMTLAGLTLY